MGFWGAVIGGVVGTFIGGPVGTLAGAAFGASAGELFEDDNPSFNVFQPPGFPNVEMSLRYFDDDEGLGCILEIPKFQAPDLFIIAQVLDENGNFVGAEEFCQDNDGHFLTHSELEHGQCQFFLPFNALRHHHAGRHLLRILAFRSSSHEGGDVTPLGSNVFEMSLPNPKPFDKVRFLKPFISLCMGVAHADGTLDSSEVRMIRSYFQEEFDLSKSDLSSMRTAMKTKAFKDAEGLTQVCMMRLPQFGLALIDLLAGVAHADGSVHPKEVAYIHRVYRALGVQTPSWDEVKEAIRFNTPAAKPLDEHYKTLDLSPGANLRQVKKAYRDKIKQYHPDRVANLPKEFQQLAQQKSVELREAYDTLCAQLKS